MSLNEFLNQLIENIHIPLAGGILAQFVGTLWHRYLLESS
jgi:hypothetical protein